MKRPTKNQWFSGVVIWLVPILRTMIMYEKSGIWYLAMVVMSVENHHDTWWVSGASF
jgi:hypothetical protein